MITTIVITLLPSILPTPIEPHQVTTPPPHVFRGLSCYGKNSGEVTSFYATSPSDCQHADIFTKPEQKPAQIISVSQFFPIQAIQCSVKVKVTTATCGFSKATDMNTHFMFNKVILDEEFSPHPKECLKANTTDELTWVIPPVGSYPGNTMTSPLTNHRASGTVFAYNQRPGTFGCTGFTWVSPSGFPHLNAALQIDFVIEVLPIWVQYNLKENTIIVPNKVQFSMSQANTFVRDIPPKPEPAIRHNNVHLQDPGRHRMLSIATRISTPEQKQQLFSGEKSNEANIAAVANDPHKSQLVDKIVKPFYLDLGIGKEVFRQADFMKRSIQALITWLHDSVLGLFVMRTQDIPLNICDSARLVTESNEGQLFRAKNKQFQDIFRFYDKKSDVGLTAFLDKSVKLCGKDVWSLHDTDIFIHMPNNTNQFMSLAPVTDQFLDKDIQDDSRLTSITASSTLNMVSVHRSLSIRTCELHRDTIKNSLSLITNDLQYMLDSSGRTVLSVVQGEVVYNIPCVEEDAIARPLKDICCDELPVFTRDEETNEFSKEMFMAPFSKRLSPYCTPTQCLPHLPSFHNVSNATLQAYYKISNGIPELTFSAPPPLSPRGTNNTSLLPTSKTSIYTEAQDNDLQLRIHQDQARQAIVSSMSLGVVNMLNSWLAPIIPTVKRQIPAPFLSAMESVFSQGPIPAFIAKLPYYAQIIIGFFSLFIFAWACGHIIFLMGAFCKRAPTDPKGAFMTTAAPTIGLTHLMSLSKHQSQLNHSTQNSLKDISNSSKQMEIQSQFFKDFVTETFAQQQLDINFLKENCVCKNRSPQCTA